MSESLSHRVQILNPDLTSYYGTFGSEGSGKGQFNEPRGMTFDGEQNLYVSENRIDARVQVFPAKGGHLQVRCLRDTKLNHPFDIAIDTSNTIYVCDTYNHRICIFDSNGDFIRSFGSKGAQPGQFNCPFGITVDKTGLIYVCEYLNGRLQIF